jgi:hypothetical protein
MTQHQNERPASKAVGTQIHGINSEKWVGQPFARHPGKKQRGVSMVDIGIWAAVAIGIIIIFVKAIGPVMAQNRARDEITEMAKIVTNIQAKWTNSPNFAGIGLVQLINADVFPRSWVNGAAVVNRWGGAVAVAISTTVTANDTMTLTSDSVPSEECKNIPQGLAESTRVITVNGTIVKPAGGTVDVPGLGVACGSGAVNVIDYAFGKS